MRSTKRHALNIFIKNCGTYVSDMQPTVNITYRLYTYTYQYLARKLNSKISSILWTHG